MTAMSDKKRKRIDRERKRRGRALDKLAAFEEFEATLLPKLRGQLLGGDVKAEEILDEHKAYAAARLVTIVATERDSTKALAAVKDLLDRTQGKAVERSVVAHKFERMDEDAIDALLISKLKEANLPTDPTNDDDEEEEEGETPDAD